MGTVPSFYVGLVTEPPISLLSRLSLCIAISLSALSLVFVVIHIRISSWLPISLLRRSSLLSTTGISLLIVDNISACPTMSLRWLPSLGLILHLYAWPWPHTLRFVTHLFVYRPFFPFCHQNLSSDLSVCFVAYLSVLSHHLCSTSRPSFHLVNHLSPLLALPSIYLP